MKHLASTFRINLVIALAVIAFLCAAPLTFAQSTNYYNSITPNPGGNPSVTNTIVPGATNVPTGEVTPLPAVPNTGGVNNSSIPSVPNTGGTQSTTATPGVPNTGAGGNAGATLLMLTLAALVGFAGISALFSGKKV